MVFIKKILEVFKKLIIYALAKFLIFQFTLLHLKFKFITQSVESNLCNIHLAWMLCPL